MALTRSFRETVYKRAQQDGAFRKALLTEAVNAYLGGDEATGKAVLRDVINATVGPRGNPSTANFFAILQVLQKRAGVKLTVKAA
ncbi:MAG: transcriptional regulator [Acidobacteria bacterium]|nr:transcriptional regulator [Acidobacteriota bacterium]